MASLVFFCLIVGTVQRAVATCRPVKRSLSERQVATAPCTVPVYAAGAQSPADKPLGEKLYLTHCAFCHGQIGEGGRGPTLARPKLIHAPDDEALKVVIRGGIPGAGMPGTRLVDAELRELAAHVRKLGQVQPVILAGDPKRGEEIYRTKGDCAACHTLSGIGGAFGPDLTGVGASRSPQHLRQSLLDPAADFPRGFAFIRATTRGGRTLTGVRVNEDTFSIQFRDAAGTLHSFWKAELREFLKDLAKSPMPSYRDLLTTGELDDLVAYLASLQEAK
jgi:putative heme-binding domain-containing protein